MFKDRTFDPKAAHRRRVARAVLQPLLSITAFVLLYYFLPLDRAFDAGTILLLAAGMAAFVGILAGQIVGIMRAEHPRLRAVAAIATSIPLFLMLFATAYFLLGRAETGAFTETLSRTDSLYFTVTVFSTVGFGDIAPKVAEARVLVMFQMIGDLVVIGVLGRVIITAVSRGLQRRELEAPAGEVPAQPKSSNAGDVGPAPSQAR